MRGEMFLVVIVDGRLVRIVLKIQMEYFFSASGWMEEGAAYPGMIFIFGGGALIIANIWQLRQDKQQALESRNEHINLKF